MREWLNGTEKVTWCDNVSRFPFVRPHGSQQTSPIDGDIISAVQLPPPQLLIDKSQKLNSFIGKPEDGLIVGDIPPQSLPPSSGFHLDAPQFEPVGIDPFQGAAEYGSNLMPSMDSPNFDYNQQVRRG